MKRLLAIVFLLQLVVLGAHAQKVEAKKCATCGKPITSCEYRGRHPKPEPDKPAANKPVASKPSANKPAGSPSNIKTFNVKGVSFDMVRVEGGTFTMGATPEIMDPEDEEKPAHQVTVGSFLIGKTEVTQALWKALMKDNPSYFYDDQMPVQQVSWDMCKTFILALNDATGKTFRLPTEAEWEFAARGGNKSKHTQYSGSSRIDDVAWYANNTEGPEKVAKKKPNELGIYDMTGNVWEWCLDWYQGYTSSAQDNPTGPARGDEGRVVRGGSWGYEAAECRNTYRMGIEPTTINFGVGFRLVLTE